MEERITEHGMRIRVNPELNKYQDIDASPEKTRMAKAFLSKLSPEAKRQMRELAMEEDGGELKVGKKVA